MIIRNGDTAARRHDVPPTQPQLDLVSNPHSRRSGPHPLPTLLLVAGLALLALVDWRVTAGVGLVCVARDVQLRNTLRALAHRPRLTTTRRGPAVRPAPMARHAKRVG